MSGIVVRAFVEADRTEVVALWTAVFADYTDPHAPAIDLCLRHPDAALFVARDDAGALAGTAMVGSDGHRGWLHYVATDPARRRAGVARALIRHGETWLATRGVSKINLQIRGDNLAVKAFYEKFGYRVEDRLSMGKRIAAPDATPLAPVAADVPGCFVLTVVYLEMVRPPIAPGPPVPALKLAVLRADAIAPAFYRFLYAEIGRDWVWHDRLALTDAELAAILHDPAVDVFVLYVAGEPGGFVELDRRRHPAEIEIRYFGLMPAQIGRGLGPWFLDWAIREAWRHAPEKLVVDTCDLDHPKALALYQRAGFAPVRRETLLKRDPRPLP